MADKLTTISNMRDFYSHSVGAVIVEAFSVDAGPRGRECFFGTFEYHARGTLVEVRFDGVKVTSTFELVDWIHDHINEIRDDIDVAGFKLLLHGNKFSESELKDVIDRLVVSTHVVYGAANRGITTIGE